MNWRQPKMEFPHSAKRKLHTAQEKWRMCPTPSQQSALVVAQNRYHRRLKAWREQEWFSLEEENHRLAEEKRNSEENQRQLAIVRFTEKCNGMGDFKFSHHSIQRVMEFNDFGNGYGEFYFSCDDKPVVGFSDIKRISEFLGTENINIKTNCVLISLDDDDSYKKVYTLCVEVGWI